ncbi:helix-turn-helix domain-containing protein [Rhodococcus qingshengii]|uniref:helix-turn-helix domain-containing protein n=1 Tax=Rhodococcus qingshengii TaxID=334542 RepID=UPI0035D86BDA
MVIDNDAGTNTFQTRLNELFAASEARLTNLRVAKGLLAQNFRISAPYLSQLRTGVRDNPSSEVIEALAEYFSVTPDYFFDIPRGEECDDLHDADAEIVDQLTELGTRKLLRSANGLSAESIELLIDMAVKMHAADDRQRRFRIHTYRASTETTAPRMTAT